MAEGSRAEGTWAGGSQAGGNRAEGSLAQGKSAEDRSCPPGWGQWQPQDPPAQGSPVAGKCGIMCASLSKGDDGAQQCAAKEMRHEVWIVQSVGKACLGRCNHQRREGGEHRSCCGRRGLRRHLPPQWGVVVVGPLLLGDDLDWRGSHRHEVDDGEGRWRGRRGWRARWRLRVQRPSTSGAAPHEAPRHPAGTIPEGDELSSGGGSLWVDDEGASS